ncbi:type IV pilus biogenesis/stability protein PilW [Streptomyces sp. NPDC001373]|uniref:tetratricopeptide repeat protein n=1 Tax=Streptomyces sp. NPDC001373 TaxID=3364565 RepID=UPI00369F50DE
MRSAVGPWRDPGDPDRTAAAFERALALDPANGPLHLDLADVRAEQGDFTTAVRFVGQGPGARGWSTSRPRSRCVRAGPPAGPGSRAPPTTCANSSGRRRTSRKPRTGACWSTTRAPAPACRPGSSPRPAGCGPAEPGPRTPGTRAPAAREGRNPGRPVDVVGTWCAY